MSNRFTSDNQEYQTSQQDVFEQTEPDVEQLVVYLDGEMDSPEVSRMEDRLSVEPDLREKMASLEQTWNMLGELETVPVDKELVRSTMEVVTLTIEKELNVDEKKIGQQKWLDRAIRATIVVMFGVVGYQLAALSGVLAKNQLLDDVPIIRQISVYKEIGSFDFLKTLSEKGVFDPPPEESHPFLELDTPESPKADDSAVGIQTPDKEEQP